MRRGTARHERSNLSKKSSGLLPEAEEAARIDQRIARYLADLDATDATENDWPDGWLAPLCSPASHLLQVIRARAADGWPIERPSMNCRRENISERRSHGEIGQRREAPGTSRAADHLWDMSSAPGESAGGKSRPVDLMPVGRARVRSPCQSPYKCLRNCSIAPWHNRNIVYLAAVGAVHFQNRLRRSPRCLP
jgi:hypothetical protein